MAICVRWPPKSEEHVVGPLNFTRLSRHLQRLARAMLQGIPDGSNPRWQKTFFFAIAGGNSGYDLVYRDPYRLRPAYTCLWNISRGVLPFNCWDGY